MDTLCEIAGGFAALRTAEFSLMGLMGVVGIVGAYVYVAPIKMIVHRAIGVISSVFGLIGAGGIGFLLAYNRLVC